MIIFTVLAFAVPNPSHAARVALVLGNSNYQHVAELENPLNDAKAVSDALERLGFEVLLGTDLGFLELRRLLRDFGDRVADSGAQTSLFYYAGHGLQVAGRNYIVPIDARLENERDLEFEAIGFDLVLSQMEQGAQTNLIFLDACRNNPLSKNLARSMGTRSAAVGQGLAQVETGIGTLIAYATQPGNIALDGAGTHSPFTQAMLEHIETPGLEVRQLMSRVRRSVHDETRGEQVPWDHSSLLGDFFFTETAAAGAITASESPTATATVSAPQADLVIWQGISNSDDPEDFRTFIDQFPASPFLPYAERRLKDLESTAKKTSPTTEDQIRQLANTDIALAESAPATSAAPAPSTETAPTLAAAAPPPRTIDAGNDGSLRGVWDSGEFRPSGKRTKIFRIKVEITGESDGVARGAFTMREDFAECAGEIELSSSGDGAWRYRLENNCGWRDLAREGDAKRDQDGKGVHLSLQRVHRMSPQTLLYLK